MTATCYAGDQDITTHAPTSSTPTTPYVPTTTPTTPYVPTSTSTPQPTQPTTSSSTPPVCKHVRTTQVDIYQMQN